MNELLTIGSCSPTVTVDYADFPAAHRQASAVQTEAQVDPVEISDHTHEIHRPRISAARAALLEGLRRSIQRGEYLTDHKIDVTVQRIHNEIIAD